MQGTSAEVLNTFQAKKNMGRRFRRRIKSKIMLIIMNYYNIYIIWAILNFWDVSI